MCTYKLLQPEKKPNTILASHDWQKYTRQLFYRVTTLVMVHYLNVYISARRLLPKTYIVIAPRRGRGWLTAARCSKVTEAFKAFRSRRGVDRELAKGTSIGQVRISKRGIITYRQGGTTSQSSKIKTVHGDCCPQGTTACACVLQPRRRHCGTLNNNHNHNNNIHIYCLESAARGRERGDGEAAKWWRRNTWKSPLQLTVNRILINSQYCGG